MATMMDILTPIESEPFWDMYNVFYLQAKSDKQQYLYGILVSTCRQTPDNKVILERKRDLDGILAWIQMTRDYDHGGSIELRISDIDDDMRKPYTSNYPGGLTVLLSTVQELCGDI
jgi:hypothetical protein